MDKYFPKENNTSTIQHFEAKNITKNSQYKEVLACVMLYGFRNILAFRQFQSVLYVYFENFINLIRNCAGEIYKNIEFHITVSGFM